MRTTDCPYSIGVVLAFIAGSVAQVLNFPAGWLFVGGVILGTIHAGFYCRPRPRQSIGGNRRDPVDVWCRSAFFAGRFAVKYARPPFRVHWLALLRNHAGLVAGMDDGMAPTQGFVFGLALSVASTVVLLRSLEEHRLLSTAAEKWPSAG